MCDPVSIVVAAFVSDAAAEVVGAEILGSTLLANAATGAITGAATAAVTGKDIGEGIIGGALGGAVGGVAGEAAKGAGASPELTRAASQFAGGTTRGLVAGQNLGQALTSGALGGATSYAGDVLFGEPPGRDAPLSQKLLAGAERGALNTAVSSLFAPSKGVGATSYSPTATTAGIGTAPSTQALSQALRTGDPGAPLFGSEGKEGKRQNVWNVASLKVKDETGS